MVPNYCDQLSNTLGYSSSCSASHPGPWGAAAAAREGSHPDYLGVWEVVHSPHSTGVLCLTVSEPLLSLKTGVFLSGSSW